MRTRTHKKQFWFNDEEKYLLAKKSKEAGMKECDYVRKVVLGYKIKEKPDERFYNAIKMMRTTANNLNQIAKKAHTFGFIDELAYKKEVEKLNNFILDIKTKYLLYEKEDNR